MRFFFFVSFLLFFFLLSSFFLSFSFLYLFLFFEFVFPKVLCVKIDIKESLVLSCSMDCTAILSSLHGRYLRTFQHNSPVVFGLICSRNGTIITYSDDNKVYFWTYNGDRIAVCDVLVCYLFYLFFERGKMGERFFLFFFYLLLILLFSLSLSLSPTGTYFMYGFHNRPRICHSGIKRRSYYRF